MSVRDRGKESSFPPVRNPSHLCSPSSSADPDVFATVVGTMNADALTAISPSSSLSQLPPDVMAMIFRYLPAATLVKVIQRVCKAHQKILTANGFLAALLRNCFGFWFEYGGQAEAYWTDPTRFEQNGTATTAKPHDALAIQTRDSRERRCPANNNTNGGGCHDGDAASGCVDVSKRGALFMHCARFRSRHSSSHGLFSHSSFHSRQQSSSYNRHSDSNIVLAATVVCDRKVYVFGGKYFRTSFPYDKRLGSAAVFDPTFFEAGTGRTGEEKQSDFRGWSERSAAGSSSVINSGGRWRPLPNMKCQRSACCAIVVPSPEGARHHPRRAPVSRGCIRLRPLIYVFGGFDGHTAHDTIEVMDPITRQWVDVDDGRQEGGKVHHSSIHSSDFSSASESDTEEDNRVPTVKPLDVLLACLAEQKQKQPSHNQPIGSSGEHCEEEQSIIEANVSEADESPSLSSATRISRSKHAAGAHNAAMDHDDDRACDGFVESNNSCDRIESPMKPQCGGDGNEDGENNGMAQIHHAHCNATASISSNVSTSVTGGDCADGISASPPPSSISVLTNLTSRRPMASGPTAIDAAALSVATSPASQSINNNNAATTTSTSLLPPRRAMAVMNIGAPASADVLKQLPDTPLTATPSPARVNISTSAAKRGGLAASVMRRRIKNTNATPNSHDGDEDEDNAENMRAEAKRNGVNPTRPLFNDAEDHFVAASAHSRPSLPALKAPYAFCEGSVAVAHYRGGGRDYGHWRRHYIFLTGGIVDRGLPSERRVASVSRLDPLTREWTAFPNLPAARHLHFSCVLRVPLPPPQQKKEGEEGVRQQRRFGVVLLVVGGKTVAVQHPPPPASSVANANTAAASTLISFPHQHQQQHHHSFAAQHQVLLLSDEADDDGDREQCSSDEEGDLVHPYRDNTSERQRNSHLHNSWQTISCLPPSNQSSSISNQFQSTAALPPTDSSFPSSIFNATADIIGLAAHPDGGPKVFLVSKSKGILSATLEAHATTTNEEEDASDCNYHFNFVWRETVLHSDAKVPATQAPFAFLW